MKHIIGIGGSGQDTILAYLRLALLAGNFQPAEAWTIDADQTGAVNAEITRLVTLIGDKKGGKVRPFPQLKDTQQQFRHLFQDIPDADRILELLFAPAQLAVPVREGMFGQPPVGATVIQTKLHRIATAEESDDPDLQRLLGDLRAPGAHEVAVVGSLFGGTGSGGVPAFCQYVRQQVNKSVGLGALAYLPWFTLGLPTAGARADGRGGIDNVGMLRNADSCVAFFRDQLSESVGRMILLGLDDDVPQREWFGPTGQPEHPHFVPLLGGYLVDCALLAGPIPFGASEINAFYYDTDARTVPIDALTVSRPDIKAVSLRTCVRETKAAIEILDRFFAYLAPPPGFSFFPDLQIPRWLRALLDRLAASRGRDRAIQELLAELSRYRAEYQRAVTWFESLRCPKFDFEPRTLVFEGKAYVETLSYPLDFFHRWFDRLAKGHTVADAIANFPEQFARELVRHLRRQIAHEFSS